MENAEEHLKIAAASTTTSSSSPNTTQNDCYDDDGGGGEHVINQNQQQNMEILNTISKALDLTEGSSATTKNEININSCAVQQEQVELEKHVVEPESEKLKKQEDTTPIDEQPAPVDLTSVNAMQLETNNLEYQTEPFNLKMDALSSAQPTGDDVHTINEITQNSSQFSSALLDLQTYSSSPSQLTPEPAEEDSQSQNESIYDEADVEHKINETVPVQQESILDLRVNNVNEGSILPEATTNEQAYQTRFSEIKDENTLESQLDSKFPAKEETKLEMVQSPVKLNGSHRYTPTEECEASLENDNFIATNEPQEVEDLAQKTNDFSMLNPSSLPDNGEHKLSNDIFSHNFDNSTEHHGSETFEGANNAESSANELNESRYSSSDSLNSASTLQSSSSHQLVIDQPTDDDKVLPLRLKLKRKHRKSTSSVESSAQPAKRANVELINSDILNEAPQLFSETPELANARPSAMNEAALVTQDIGEQPENTAMLEVTAPLVVSQTAIALPPPPTVINEAPTELMPAQIQPPTELCENLTFSNKTTENLDVSKPTSAAAQYYKCSACGTYHENWSFFLHLQEKHDRFLCLYCIKCFPTAEKLALHLEIKHDLEQNHFNTEEAFRNSALIIHGFNLETRFLMCCTCQYIFRENAAFTEHACIEFMKSCITCGQKGRHTNQCKANPLAKRRNKKKIRAKTKPTSFETAPQIEPTPPPHPTLLPPLLPPPPTVLNELAPQLQQQEQPLQPQQQEVPLKRTPVRRHSEDSNSSSNMVIDESCNTNHNLMPNQINPFKALDEEEAARYTQAAEETTNTESLLNSNVFKFKLRVPKEFQKPVDEEISTSESEQGEVAEDGNADINSNQVEYNNDKLEQVKAATVEAAAAAAPSPFEATLEEANNETSPMRQSEEESVDDTAANEHLARILQEIEQTKLDIEKTKETLHHRQQKKSESTAQESAVDEAPLGDTHDTTQDAAAAGEHWTPTPPASPTLHTAIAPTLVDEPNETNLDVADVESQPSPQTMTAPMAEVSEENLPPPPPPPAESQPTDDAVTTVTPAPPDDGIDVANEDCLLVELQLDRPLDQFETVEFVRICLKAAYPYCLYCNHARRIAVNAESLVLHLIAQHRFIATVDSITAEELQTSTLVAKLKSFLPELHDQFMNSSSYCTIGEGRFTRHFNERIFECFQCRFVTSTHKELYLHNRKMHLRTAILCFMCRCNFYSFSEILCHICPGVPHRVSIFEIKFRCCLCDLTEIPSPFRLMVHLRKAHFACDVCLEDCRDQSKLSSHVWKHKLHHLCYRCGIAYRNKLDITKHLFWKHGTESALCKRCLQKRWPHVYHFCVPPAIFSCDVCQLCFSKAMYLTVHKRLHQNDFRYACTEAGCQEKFISRKLLLKHSKVHETAEMVKDELAESAENGQKLEEKEEKPLNKEKPALEHETDTKNETETAVKNEKEDIKEVADGEKATAIDANSQMTAVPSEQQQQQTPQATEHAMSTTEVTSNEQPTTGKKHKKRKKRAKESLEDLNLTAPNLSESGSSSESESETKSNFAANNIQELALSPLSEHGDQKSAEKLAIGESSAVAENNGNVLDIWKNFLQAQQLDGELHQFAEYTEDDYPAPKCLHVCNSDHDYCAMFPPRPPANEEEAATPPKAKHESTSGRTRNFSSSSDASSDDSSSSSSCSCGSNCSCSNGSSSSSSSGDSSDSSNVSATKKRLRKKSERSNRHRKSFSSSPLKPQHNAQHNTSGGGGGENINVIDTDDNANETTAQIQDEETANPEEVKANLEPTINESDLETAESETDEEYYDEHPQKLATELLSQKRAQLMARTLLSPSHNFDIVENSRPSTPSLPEDVIYEKRQKKKKNKRERKSTSNNKLLAITTAANQLHGYLAATNAAAQEQFNTEVTPTEHFAQSQASNNAYMQPHEVAQPRPMPPALMAAGPNHYIPRISEGSSCSDADNSLKRSKRQRRPNKFYGYTSDDDSMAPAAQGQSLIIGMRAYKPLPPPQLVWDKEDLPTPDKSILNVSKKSTRQLSTPNTTNAIDGGAESSSKKKRTATSHRKRNSKHAMDNKNLPPIPRLKIRPALFNKSIEARDLGLDCTSDSSDNDEQHTGPPPRKRTFPPKQSTQAFSSFLPRYLPNQHPQQQQQTIVPVVAPPPPPPPPSLPMSLPPTPQTTAFNHKIPPALLPNPDFSTLQYFKANNIRYPIRPPAGARAAREGESVYCYCRCPYDEVSEMIACDGDSCLIEWFHFECVGIMLAPQGKWFCAECRPQYSEELYPTTSSAANTASSNFA